MHNLPFFVVLLHFDGELSAIRSRLLGFGMLFIYAHKADCDETFVREWEEEHSHVHKC